MWPIIATARPPNGAFHPTSRIACEGEVILYPVSAA